MQPLSKPFSPLQLSQTNSDDLLQKECLRILDSSDRIDVTEACLKFSGESTFLNLILSILHSLLKKLSPFKSKEQILRDIYCSCFKISVFKLVASIIQKKLYTLSEPQLKFMQEISYSIVFKESLSCFLINTISENNSVLFIEKLIHFFRSLNSSYENFLMYLPIHSYHIYGGGPFTIDRKKFKNNLIQTITKIGSNLSSCENLVTRNLEHLKKMNPKLLQESIKIVMFSKSKDNMQPFVTRLTLEIFGQRDYLKKEEFLVLIKQLKSNLIIFLFELLRAENMLISENSYQYILNKRNEVAQNNFYSTEMSKILSKCPFNGDERCSCKKCHCVRRNRESAKASQQKKRNALQQLDSFKKYVSNIEVRNKELQVTNKQLEEENAVLKGLLMKMNDHESVKKLLVECVEPVNKILNNDIE